jgi:lysophospholipase L1-like esterase
MARDYVHMTLDGYNRSADRFADYLKPLISQAWTAARVVSDY